MRKEHAGLLFVFFFLALGLGSCRGPMALSGGAPSSLPMTREVSSELPACLPRNMDREWARVVEVVDGDTIVVDLDGRSYRVRYIGMDTPERDEPLYEEARRRNSALVMGREVFLVQDVSETDRYGRLLRYVLRREGEEWVLVNEILVREGLARAVTYPPDVAFARLFLEAQREARQNARGLWAVRAFPVETSTAACDPSCPDICLPPPPPDLDCGDIPVRGFRVLPPDPHNLDADGDGVGCEGG